MIVLLLFRLDLYSDSDGIAHPQKVAGFLYCHRLASPSTTGLSSGGITEIHSPSGRRNQTSVTGEFVFGNISGRTSRKVSIVKSHCERIFESASSAWSSRSNSGKPSARTASNCFPSFFRSGSLIPFKSWFRTRGSFVVKKLVSNFEASGVT